MFAFSTIDWKTCQAKRIPLKVYGLISRSPFHKVSMVPRCLDKPFVIHGQSFSLHKWLLGN